MNKILYSRFYSLGYFTAYWTKAKQYRDLIKFYGIVTLLAVDLYLFVISIVGLFMLEWGTQLYINLIESAVLALLMMVLSSLEMFKYLNPGNLEYTWNSEKSGRLRVSSAYNDPNPDDDEFKDQSKRETSMRKLLSKVNDSKLKQQHIE